MFIETWWFSSKLDDFHRNLMIFHRNLMIFHRNLMIFHRNLMIFHRKTIFFIERRLFLSKDERDAFVVCRRRPVTPCRLKGNESWGSSRLTHNCWWWRHTYATYLIFYLKHLLLTLWKPLTGITLRQTETDSNNRMMLIGFYLNWVWKSSLGLVIRDPIKRLPLFF